MGAKHKLKSDISNLQYDVSRVLHDISKLSSHLRTAGKEAVETGGKQVSETIETQLGDLWESLATINDTLKEYGTMANKSMRRHPVAYSIGAAGAIYLLGKWLLGNRQSLD